MAPSQAPGAGGESNAPPGVPFRPKRGGKRPGAGRKKRPPAPEPFEQPSLDVTRHVSPNVAAVTWTPELEDRFIQAYFDKRCNMLGASRVTGVPYRAAVGHREQDSSFAERLQWADLAYRDVLLDEQQRRALDDPNRPASLIFELKSRHPQYTPATGGTGVKVNIAFIDKAFGASQAIEALPERKALVEPVIDVSVEESK